MSKDFLYGMYYLQWCFRDSNGYPMGTVTDPDNVADGTTTHSYLLSNPVEYTAPSPSFGRAIDRGGQTVRAQVDMGVTDFGEGSFSLSELDDTIWAYWNGSSVDSATVSGWRQVAMNVNNITAPPGFIIISTKAYDYENSANVWSHWIYPNAQIRVTLPSASQSDGENPNPWELTLIPNTSNRTLTGHLFSATGMNVTQNTDIGYRVQTAKQIAITTYVVDAVPTQTFSLGYRPSSSLVDNSDKVITQNGVTDSVTSVNTTTGVVTGSGLLQSEKIVAVYETEYTAI